MKRAPKKPAVPICHPYSGKGLGDVTGPWVLGASWFQPLLTLMLDFSSSPAESLQMVPSSQRQDYSAVALEAKPLWEAPDEKAPTRDRISSANLQVN